MKGSLVAIITPFDMKGRIDRKKLEKLIEWHIDEGTDGIVCTGATGEPLSLSDSERKKVAEICIKTASKKIPIIVGTGVSDTKQTVHYTELAKGWGADGCMVVTPYYNKPTQRGCILHFKEVAKVGLPVILYNNPGRTGVKLTAETIAEASKIPGVVAIKEASHDLELIRNIKKLCSIPILAGEDELTFQILQEGGVGAISVIGNLIPRGWREMIWLAMGGKWQKAKAMSDRYQPLCSALFLETNPQCVKFAVSLLGKCQNVFRLPLVEPLEKTQIEIRKVLLNLALPQFQSFIKSQLKG
jgi:4-hydroxy-tetrahydrodipicolinate synthase